MKAIHLKTEYLPEPLGLGTARPRFYWNCTGGIRQTAYQIVCTRGDETVWDSGKVVSSSMTHIAYGGSPLQSRDCVCWRVRLWDENDRPGDWSESRFELGLLRPEDWQAKWITGDYSPKKNTRYPADCFRKSFTAGKGIARARLYITACGLYEAVLNDQRVGDFQLAPGSTDYRKRIQYQTYDVTALLREKNTLDVTLADGWYRGSIGAFGFTNVYGRQTKLLCQLELTYADGKRETVLSDESWQWGSDGPVRFADLKDGESIDAAMQPTFSGHARLAKETVVPTASDNVFPTMHERFPAKRLATPSGKTVLDFGQNLAGFLSFRAKGSRGKKIRLLLGETLDGSGEFTQENFQLQRPVKEPGQLASILLITGNAGKLRGEKQPTPKQEIVFRCSGGEDRYQTRFAVFGFRYALLEMDAGVEASEFEAIAVYSDLAQTGEFSCSNEKINRLVSAARWSMKSNFLDVPTDCPTRERLAWTGDAQIFFDTGSCFMDTAPFFRKWLRDLRDAQKKNGQLPAVAPYSGASMLYDNTGTSAGWLDCGVLLPYRFWKRYGDLRTLREAYPLLRDTAEFMRKHTGHKDKKAAKADPNNAFVYEYGVQLGEWLEPKDFRDEVKAGRTEAHTEEATAYFFYSMTCAAEAAHALGEVEDETRFRNAAEGAKRAYQALFLHSCPDTDRQAKLVRPLALGLADGEMAKALAVRLAQAVQNREYRIGTGFLSTPFVLEVLTKCGRSELAYKMLENEACPGWLYEIDHGATTLWEEWEGGMDDSNSGSRNHYSPGAVCGWLFDTCAGIRVDGENRFVIAPTPGGTLCVAEGSYQSIYGKVSCRWAKTDAGTEVTVTIPPNCTAAVHLPDGEEIPVGAGVHTFISNRSKYNMKTNYEFWFIVGSQTLYGEDVLTTVANRAEEMAQKLSAVLPYPLKYKVTAKSSAEITQVVKEANYDDSCAGIVTWCHTFSPSKMWINGLDLLQKPWLHFATQYNREIPNEEIDMDFMNLNQAAHGDREHGFIGARLRKPRKIIAGYWQDSDVQTRIGSWMKAAIGVAVSKNMKVMRFGDNMRNVAVTEGDKVEVQKKLGWEVNTWAVGDLVKEMNAVTEAEIDALMDIYREKYDIATDDIAAIRYQAREEIAMKKMMDAEGCKAFSNTFQDLYGMEQLPGLASQHLMAQGYGYGGEGDWKVAAMTAILKAMGEGGNGASAFMEDYTYHLVKGQEYSLGAHMLEVCPSVASGRPRIETHFLGIGMNEKDPARLVFEGKAGKGVVVSLIDMGGRLRLIVQDIEAVKPIMPMPNLPVARVMWRAMPDLTTGVECWITAGGAHHTVLSYDVTADQLRDWARMMEIEFVHITKDTTVENLEHELFLNDLAWKLK